MTELNEQALKVATDATGQVPAWKSEAIIRAYLEALPLPPEVADVVKRLHYHSEHPSTGALVLTNPDGPEAAALIASLSSRLAEVERERGALRGALIQVGRRVGAGLADTVSSEFLLNVPAETDAVLTRAERLAAERGEALEPFATKDWTDDIGWSERACPKDRICDWFGPSDFRRARTAHGDGK